MMALPLHLFVSIAVGLLLPAVSAAAAAAAPNTTNSTLHPFALSPLPLGAVHPTGWLRTQLRLSATGLAGNLYAFYAPVGNSSWLHAPAESGTEYSALREALPYWLQGAVPLGALAGGDVGQVVLGQAREAAERVLALQQEDGWIGPETGRGRNLWARYPVLMGLVGLVEVEPEVWETRVLDALRRFTTCLLGMLRNGLSGYVWREGDELSEQDFAWGRARVADLLGVMMWVVERSGTGEEWKNGLWECMELLVQGAMDWGWWWEDGFIEGDLNSLDSEGSDGPRYPFEHGVNAGQGLKTLATIHRLKPANTTLASLTRLGVNKTLTHHASAYAALLADERLAGLSPYYGSETCTLVETIRSLTTLYQLLGDASFADAAERLAFNALPAQLAPDGWARQYVGQVNQPNAAEVKDGENRFFNVGPRGTMFTVEGNYPCCTVNHGQGWPRFAAAAWAAVGETGVAHALLVPSRVRTRLAGAGEVYVECKTQYPFGLTLEYAVSASKPFSLHLRVPGWADAGSSTIALTTASTNGTNSTTLVSPLTPDPHTALHALSLPAGSSKITYTLSPNLPALTPIPRANATIALQAGPLAFGLAVNASIVSTAPKRWNDAAQDLVGIAGPLPAQARDYLLTNASAWSVGVDAGTFRLRKRGVSAPGWDEDEGEQIFAPGKPPLYAEALGCEIGWPDGGAGAAAPLPLEERRCLSEVRWWRFEVVGAARLRVGEVPVVDLGGEGGDGEEGDGGEGEDLGVGLGGWMGGKYSSIWR